MKPGNTGTFMCNLHVHVLPSSCEELPTASRQSPFSTTYAPGGLNELTYLKFIVGAGLVPIFEWNETAVMHMSFRRGLLSSVACRERFFISVLYSACGFRFVVALIARECSSQSIEENVLQITW